jgi:hypothetical protein
LVRLLFKINILNLKQLPLVLNICLALIAKSKSFIQVIEENEKIQKAIEKVKSKAKDFKFAY